MGANDQANRPATGAREDKPVHARPHMPALPRSRTSERAAVDPPPVSAEEVTLFVYGWFGVQPGPLSWVFPSLSAATRAVDAMRNAVHWAIVRGRLETPTDGDDGWKCRVLRERRFE